MPPPPSAVPPSHVQDAYVPPSSSNRQVASEDMVQAQKFVKFAASALTYEDVPSAIENLQKALRVLQGGHFSQ